MDESKGGFEFLDQLRKKNVKKNQFYNELMEHLNFKAREKGIPVAGEFELTPLCNFDCRMCYVHLNADQLKGQRILSVGQWKEIMRQAWEAGMLSASLTGGECLAYPGFEELFLYLQSLGCATGVLTNGFLLDEERIRFFKKHRPSSIQMTLYGWNDDVYERVTGKRAFTVVADHIRQAVEAELPVRISITPSRYLGEDLFETIRTARELCNYVTLNSYINPPREETGRSGEQHDSDLEIYIRALAYLDQLQGYETKAIREELLPPCGGPCHETSECGLRCGGGRSGFAVNWKGQLLPCLDLDVIHGDALKDGFAAAWAKVNREVNQWPRVPECEGCPYEEACLNCAAHMLQFAEPGKRPEELCRQTRMFVKNGIRHIPDCE